MQPSVVTKDPASVKVEVQSTYQHLFPKGNRAFVSEAFGMAVDCFRGRYKDYQPVDLPYHDLEHTLQGTLCFTQLLRGRHAAGVTPQLSQRVFELGVLAILLHDTGYLKKASDTHGTGAKYTITHVRRSADFASELLGEKGFAPAEIKAVQNMIYCTGVDSMLSGLPFQSEQEKIVGHALGTADLLGQMAAADYVEKLTALYREFAEAATFSKDRNHFVASFSSAEELMKRTPDFWENSVQPKLNRDFEGLYRFLNHPYPDGPNDYIARIESNIERLRKLTAVTAS